MSCKFGTGQTMYNIIMSVDNNNIPLTGTTLGGPVTFTINVYKDGLPDTGTTVNQPILTDSEIGVYSSSWTANTVGTYQLLYKNDVTDAVFITENYRIVDDSDLSTNVYIGL